MNLKNNSRPILNKIKLHTLITRVVSISLCILCFVGCQTPETPVPSETDNYARDRALIEDLEARYMFALDNGDLDTYVSTYTEDGILDIGEGEWRGRDTIRQILASIPQQPDSPLEKESSYAHRATGRHNITNTVLKIEGDTAYGRAYWFHVSNNNPQRSAVIDSYGHYEDVIVRVEDQWLFSKRKIYNEQVAKWAAPKGNPCW